MNKQIAKLEAILAAAILTVAVAGAPLVANAAVLSAVAQAQSADSDAAAVQSRLNKKQFQNVHVALSAGVATLTGTVDLYEYKVDAEKKALHTKGVTAVRNQIEVSGTAFRRRTAEEAIRQARL